MKKSTSVMMISALLIICLFPVWGRLLPGSASVVTGENRSLSPFPGTETPLSRWPSAFEDWFGDRLAFRREAISAAARFQYRSTLQAVEGKDGWLFFLGDGSKDDLLRRTVLGTAEKESIREAQQMAKDRIAEAGAAYMVLICPDKQTVYPEYLPDVFRLAQGESRLDQITPVLKDIPGLVFVDPRESMIREKEDKPLYYLTDTHWNDLGAWTACRAVYAALSETLPSFRAPSEKRLRISDAQPAEQGDLARMLNRQNMKDLRVSVTLRGLRADGETIPNPDDPLRCTTVYENPDHPGYPRAVVFHDSFAEALRPFLAPSFSRIVFVWSDHPLMDIVREEKPDIVIQEYVERLCPTGLPKPPSEPVPAGPAADN